MTDDDRLAALAALYELRLDAFVRTATAIAGSREAGRDAVNDAFVRAIRRRGQFRGDGVLEAWVWRIVVREASKARRRVGAWESAATTAPSGNGHGDQGAEIRATIALLPERQRTILFLRYYADLDYQQIADTLRIRRGTVSAALHAAHRALRGRLEEVLER